MTTITPSSPKPKVSIILLTVVKAAIHLYLGFQGLPLFVLNGLGYLALLTPSTCPSPGCSRTGTPCGGCSSVTRP